MLNFAPNFIIRYVLIALATQRHCFSSKATSPSSTNREQDNLEITRGSVVATQFLLYSQCVQVAVSSSFYLEVWTNAQSLLHHLDIEFFKFRVRSL